METNVRKKKHHTAENSQLSFVDFNRTGQRTKETVKVFDALKYHQPATSRRLVYLTGLERTNLCRILFDVTHAPDPLVKIVFDKPCLITKKKVHWYALIDYESDNEMK